MEIMRRRLLIKKRLLMSRKLSIRRPFKSAGKFVETSIMPSTPAQVALF
jgi:hypothetical protein